MNRWFPGSIAALPRSGQPLSRRLSSPMPPGHPTQHLERQHMPLAERPWAAWLANATCNRLARGARTAGQPATPLVKVPSSQTHSSPKSIPGLLTNPVDVRHGHTPNPTSQLSTQLSDVAADGRLAQLGAVAVDQPLPASAGRYAVACLGAPGRRSPTCGSNGFHGPSTGAARSERFRSGGTALISAWRTVRRCTR
jgi:hypothetical protein